MSILGSINVGADLARYRCCGRTFRLSDLLDARVDSVDLQHQLPFIVASVPLIAQCLMTVMGMVEIRRDGEDAVVFTGIGWLGWSRRFRWSEAHSIREDTVSRGRGTAKVILIEGQSRIAFGSALSNERRDFLLRALKRLKLTT